MLFIPLYHASFRIYEDSIDREGLKPGGSCQTFNWCSKEYVYLIDDKDIAKSFTDGGSIELDDDDEYERLISEGGVLYTINRAALDESKLEKDPHWNVNPEDAGGNSFGYKGVIPKSAIIKKEYYEIDG